MRTVSVDDSGWPLVIVTYSGVPRDDEFDDYLKRLSINLERAQRERIKIAMVFDATESAGPNAKHRARQAEWMKEHEALSKLHSAGYAFIIPSSFLRGVLTAILWLAPMPAPHVIVASLAEGERWCRQRLSQGDVDVRVTT